MYTFDSRVRYSETDAKSKLTIDSMLNYLQDCTNFHSEDLGVGLEYLLNNKKTWVLNYWQVIVEDYPKMGDYITVGTQAYGFEKMFGYRNFQIARKDEPEKRILVANSIWSFLDLEKMRPMIIPKEFGEVYGKHERLPMAYTGTRKVKAPKEGGRKGEVFTVKTHHLDTNQHVNNVQYVRMALDAIGKEILVKEFRVEYRRQAVLGDKICPVIYEQGNEVFVELCDGEGKAYAIAQFIV